MPSNSYGGSEPPPAPIGRLVFRSTGPGSKTQDADTNRLFHTRQRVCFSVSALYTLAESIHHLRRRLSLTRSHNAAMSPSFGRPAGAVQMLPRHNAASFSLKPRAAHTPRSRPTAPLPNDQLINYSPAPLKPFALPRYPSVPCPPCKRNQRMLFAGPVEKNSNGPILRDDANQLFFNH